MANTMVSEEVEYLDVKGMALLLKKAVKTVYVYIETGVIPERIVYRFRNSPRVKKQDLLNYIESKKGI